MKRKKLTLLKTLTMVFLLMMAVGVRYLVPLVHPMLVAMLNSTYSSSFRFVRAAKKKFVTFCSNLANTITIENFPVFLK